MPQDARSRITGQPAPDAGFGGIRGGDHLSTVRVERQGSQVGSWWTVSRDCRVGGLTRLEVPETESPLAVERRQAVALGVDSQCMHRCLVLQDRHLRLPGREVQQLETTIFAIDEELAAVRGELEPLVRGGMLEQRRLPVRRYVEDSK